jgi:AcrR family transcriptional regulator
MQKKIDNNEMKEKLIQTTLDLIDQQGGLHGVNLRQIAFRAGCAHTNIYNYYQDFEDLLWDVIMHIGELWMEYSEKNFTDNLTLEEASDLFASVQFDLAEAHPGWYRCLWQESLSGNLPEKVMESRRESRDAITRIFIRVSKNRLDQAHANRLFQIIFTFIHGSISLMINGRIVRTTEKAYRAQVLDNVQFIVNSFLTENTPST